MKSRIIVIGIVVLLAGVGVAGLWFYLGRKPDTSVLEDIADKLKHNDISNEVNCRSVDDCGFEVKGEYNIVLKYGDMRIIISRAAFFDEEFNARLADIGIKIQYRSDDNGVIQYRLTYYGETITEYSILNF